MTVNNDNCVIFFNEFTIKEGKVDEVKTLLSTALDKTKEEEGMLNYTFAFSDDDTVFVAQETFKNGEAFLAHVENIGESLGKLMELVDCKITVLCPKEEHEKLKEMLEAFPHTYLATHSGLRKD